MRFIVEKSRFMLSPLLISSRPGLKDAISPAKRGKAIIILRTAKNRVDSIESSVIFACQPPSFFFTLIVSAMSILLSLQRTVPGKLGKIDYQRYYHEYYTDGAGIAKIILLDTSLVEIAHDRKSDVMR